MMQHETPDDYVLATGKLHSIQDFLHEAFSCVGLKWQDYVATDPRYVRPNEPYRLLGDPSKASSQLGWQATTPFSELVKLMVQHDLQTEGLEPASVFSSQPSVT